ncbi:MAG: T9SS type A sorting domain-containing protein [Bacteroidota bacterium]
MKKLKFIVILSLLFVAGNDLYAQTGELNRFSNEELGTVNTIHLFPNPAVEVLKVRITNSTLSSPKLVVHNIIGSEVEVEINQISEEEFSLKIEDLAPGYYLVAIRDEESHFGETYKFVKR